MKRTKKRIRRGAATVEFAMVAMVFFVFVFAMVEFGRGMMVINLLQHTARTACRYGIVPSTSTAEITAAANDALKDQGLSDVSIVVKVNGVAGETKTASTNDRITVVVSAPVASNSWLPLPRFLQGSLSGQFSLTRE